MHIVSSRTNRFYSLLLVLMTSISAIAQSPSKNYVQTKTFLDDACSQGVCPPVLRTESGHPLRLTYGGINIYDKNIPELYQKAMLWKDWKEASKGQRR